MPNLTAKFRLDVAPARLEPDFPSWVDILSNFESSVVSGHESTEFEDGQRRHAPVASRGIITRRIIAQVAGDRVVAWRRFLASAPGVLMRFRDVEDGIHRRVVLEPQESGIAVRQIATGSGPTRWQSTITLTGLVDDIVEE